MAKAQSEANRRKAARDAGVCTRCFRTSVAPDRATCASCLEQRRQQIAARSKGRYDAGQCVYCNDESRVGAAVYGENCRVRNLARSKQSKVDLRQQILDAYGRECVCCGEDIEEFLQLDHVDDNGSEERRHLNGTSQYHELRRRGFPSEGYQMLCANCNWAKRLGQCPHQGS